MSGELIPEVLPEDTPMSLWDHVGELRDRLIRCALAVFGGTMVTYVLRFRLWALATKPFMEHFLARKDLAGMVQPFAYTDLAEPFLSFMRLSFWTAVLVVSPYLFYQLWAFVKPALRERERRLATRFVLITSGCFVLGACFAYFYMFPTLGDILLSEGFNAGLRANLKPNEYLDLFLYTVIGTGLAFETPVLFYFLARFGMVRSEAMLKYWREATIVILFVAGFLTPGDVVATMIVFGVVMLALYFLSAGVVWLVEKGRALEGA